MSSDLSPVDGGMSADEVLRDLVPRLPAAAYRCRNHRDWTMVELGERILDLTGYTADQLTGEAGPAFGDLIHPGDRDRVWEEVQAALAAGEPFRVAYRIRTRDGEERWVWEQGHGIEGEAGAPKELVGFIQDVGEIEALRRKAREEELDRLHRQAEFLSLLQAITAIVNETLTFAGAVDAALTRVCTALDFPVGHAFLRTSPGGALESSSHWSLVGDRFEAFRAATDSGTWPIMEGLPGRVAESAAPEWVLDVKSDPRFFRIDETTESPVQAGVAVPVMSGRKALAVLEFYTDRPLDRDPEVERLLEQVGVQLGRVWEREMAARALEESERRLLLLADNVDAVLWIASADGEALFVSDAYRGLTRGASPPRHMRDLLDLVHPEDRARVGELLSNPGRTPYEDEFRLIREDGEVAWVRQRAFPLDEAGRSARRIGGILEDITERRRAWERLEATTRLLKQTIESLDEAVLVIDTAEEGRRIVDVNAAAESMFGYPRDELVSTTTERLHVDADRFRRFGEMTEAVLAREGVVHAAYPLRRRDGTVFEAEQTVTLLDRDRGLAGGAVSVVRDMSEKGELERQLRQSQKMEAVGRLAGGVAHDFNNLLTVIRAHSDFVLLELEPDSELAPEIVAIQEAADRAARLTGQLLAFGREQVLRPRVVDLNEIVRGTRHFLGRVLGEDIRISTDLSAGMLAVRVDPNQLEQVIMNLAMNARDAMPEGGALTLSSERSAWREGDDGGLAACLRVSDTGAGMDEETLSRIFEPFFTTKEETGTGLGLATAYGIVTQSGGTIEVASEVGSGTTFTIRFPVEESEPEPLLTPSHPVQDDVAPVSATILLVEDDESVQRVTRKVLEREGLEVVGALDGETALELLDRDPLAIDLLLTDLVLPGMNGREVVARVRARRDVEIPIIIMSGYDEDGPRRSGELPPDISFLQKPFTPRQLVALVRETLVREGPADPS